MKLRMRGWIGGWVIAFVLVMATSASAFELGVHVGLLADLSLTPVPFLDIHAGYKLVQLKVDQNNYLMDVFYTGPYAGLTLGF